MKVIASKERFWFLVEDEDKLYLDVNCSMSFIGYSWTIELNKEEKANFQSKGDSYIDELAYEINDTIPIKEDSDSKFKSRKVSQEIEEKITEAILSSKNS